MRTQLITRVIRAYGYASGEVLAPQKGYRNEAYPVILKDGPTINCILYKSEPGILRKIYNANRVADYVGTQGFPARQTYDPRIICMRSSSLVKYAALYTYLPGHTIPWEAYTMQHIKLLGKTLSDMHVSLRSLPQMRLPNVVDEYNQIVDRMRGYFHEVGVTRALTTALRLRISKDLLASVPRLLQMCRQLPGQQALHMDFVRSNILFDTDADEQVIMSGILDFEKTAWGHPYFDIARTLAFLLVDCKHKTDRQVRKYFLQSGYTKRGASAYRPYSFMHDDCQQDVLECLLDLFLVYDFYKFLRHNPYEYLSENQHFVRTRDILLQRGWLQQIEA